MTRLLDAGLTAFLTRHVRWNAAGTATAVEYAGVRRDRSQLQGLLAGFSRITLPEFSSWKREAREVFLVNAYKVLTLALIADAPADTRSIKGLGGFLRDRSRNRVERRNPLKLAVSPLTHPDYDWTLNDRIAP